MPELEPRSGSKFGKDRRLLRRTEFQEVFDAANRMRSRYFTLLTKPTPHPQTRLGIVASRKLGDAVRRNRAKRLIREIFRRNKTVLAGVDIVVIPRTELFQAPYASLEEDFRSALERCAARLSKHGRS
jgi:ribonuclease P protein component